MLSHDDEPIIAQCTPQGKGALALIRISGTHVRTLADACAHLASGKKIADVPSHTIHYGWIIDDQDAHIDQVMIIIMDGPKTFTGQDVIEITCHNNPFLIESIIAQAIKKGARLAQEGEFSKRAFLNSKIDLIQAEAINELISANTQLALKKSLSQLKGSFSHWIEALEKDLLRAIAWCEASFEFLDEERDFKDQIQAHVASIITRITTIKKTFSAQQQIRQGIRITLIGSVNVGKSSLFNALLDQKRAIVTDISGTTRDVIEAGVYHQGNYWTLIDTAGLRQTEDSIEQEGIKRSFEEAHKADIVLLVFDGSKPLTTQEANVYNDILEKYPRKNILVHHKADLPPQKVYSLLKHADLHVSSHTRQNIEELQQLIEKRISILFDTMESPFLFNKRHQALLLTLEQKMVHLVSLFTDNIQYEIISYHLQDALSTLSELTGKSVSEAGLDMVFKEFCVGK